MRAIILCKAPVAGRVKTRLMPAYTAEEAARIHERMAETVLSKVTSMFDDVWLAVDDIKHSFFIRASLKYHFKLRFQGSGDLGVRLKTLINQSFRGSSESVLFLGTDSPHISTDRYQQVLSHIKACDVVIGPVEDGGYDLIALKQSFNFLFDGIDWGSEHVLTQTLAICVQHKLKVSLLDTSFDLDRADDIKRAPVHTW